MQTSPHDLFQPWRFAAEGAHLQVTLKLATMPRLCELLLTNEGQVAVTLEGGVELKGPHYLQGYAETDVSLLCQRCMQPMRFPLQVKFRLGLIHAETEANHLSADYEPLLASEQHLLSDIIEDELLLALPIVAKHEPAACGETVAATPIALDPNRQQPFADLATRLKQT